MRVLHLTDRLSARGGADWHLLGVIRAQVRDPGRDGGPAAVTLAVGKMDNTVAPPCPTERAACLSARDERPAEAALRPLVRKVAPDLLHLHNVVNPAVLEWAAGAGLPALATVQDHRAFCPGRGKWTASGQVCDAPLCRKRCRECFTDQGYFDAIYALTRRRLGALARLDALTVLSDYMKRELVAAGVPPRQVRVIPPFVHGLADRPTSSSSE